MKFIKLLFFNTFQFSYFTQISAANIEQIEITTFPFVAGKTYSRILLRFHYKFH